MTRDRYAGSFIGDSNKRDVFVQKVSKWVNCSDIAYLATACLYHCCQISIALMRLFVESAY